MKMSQSGRYGWARELVPEIGWLLSLAACGLLLAGCAGTFAGSLPAGSPTTKAGATPLTQAPTIAPQPTPEPSAVASREGVASLLSEEAKLIREVSADLDDDGREELVVLAAFGASPERLSAERLELFIFEPTSEGHRLEWQSEKLLGERAEPLRVEDINRDGRPEVISVQSMGAAGETLYVFAWLGDRYGALTPHGGYFDGRPSFGENAARLDVDGDGVPEIQAGYGPGASETAIYRWDGNRYAIVEESTAMKAQMTLTVDQEEYKPGEPVRFTFTVRNGGPMPVAFDFRSGQRFDIEVVDSQGTQVWQWSHGRFFIQALGTMELAAGESKSFEATWDQKDSQGNQVASGPYSASAWLATTGEPRPASAEFAIQGTAPKSP